MLEYKLEQNLKGWNWNKVYFFIVSWFVLLWNLVLLIISHYTVQEFNIKTRLNSFSRFKFLELPVLDISTVSCVLLHRVYMVYLPCWGNVTDSQVCYECLYQTVSIVVPVSLSHTETETLLYIHIQMLCGPRKDQMNDVMRKSVFGGLRLSKTQTSLLKYRS